MNDNLPVLPKLRDSIIDAERVIEVIPKIATREYASQSSLTLDDAHALFLSGRACVVQIRYVLDGVQWWVTIMQTPAGIRLARIRHDDGKHEAHVLRLIRLAEGRNRSASESEMSES